MPAGGKKENPKKEQNFGDKIVDKLKNLNFEGALKDVQDVILEKLDTLKKGCGEYKVLTGAIEKIEECVKHPKKTVDILGEAMGDLKSKISKFIDAIKEVFGGIKEFIQSKGKEGVDNIKKGCQHAM